MPYQRGGPPLELTVEVTSANGAQYRWGPGQRAGSVPQGLNWKTKQAEGFADGGTTLARRVDREHVDLHLLDEIVISGADGSIAYEGRVEALPRTLADTHQVAVAFTGWMAHTRDRKAYELYVDRDLGEWGAPAATRQVTLLTANYSPVDPSATTDSNGAAALRLQPADQWTAPTLPLSEAWYDAGPSARIGVVYYSFTNPGRGSISDTTWDLLVRTANDDAMVTVGANSGDLWGLLPEAGYLTDPSHYRYALLSFYNNATPGGAANYDYSVHAKDLAVYGDHGLPLIGTDPKGVAASDVIRHVIGKYCPKVNTGGVQDTTYPISHLEYRDGVDPYDVVLDVNKYHLWQFGVWERRTLTFEPIDMTDYDWEVRISDPGTTITWQGDSTSTLANGVIVTYPDLATGKTNILTPEQHPELADPDPANPYNQHGYQAAWTNYTIPTPQTQDAALQIGRAFLAEFNQPTAPGSITVHGHIRDRAGHWQPFWKVRAGDRLIIADHPNDRVRRVVETDINNDAKTVTIAVDSTFSRLDAAVDRQATALRASNLGT